MGKLQWATYTHGLLGLLVLRCVEEKVFEVEPGCFKESEPTGVYSSLVPITRVWELAWRVGG